MFSHPTIRTILIALPAVLYLILVWLVSEYLFPQVHRGLLLAIAVLLAVVLEIVIWWISRPKSVGNGSVDVTTIVGQTAEVIHDLTPSGVVRIHDELWNATSIDGAIVRTGERVLVESIDGLNLVVKRS